MVDKIIVENRTDLIDCPYVQASDIRDLDSWFNKLARQTRVDNVYDNQVSQEYT